MKNALKKIFTITHLNLFMVIVLVVLVAYPLFAPIVPANYDKPTIVNAGSLYAGHTITYKIHTCRNVNDGVLTIVTRKLVSSSDKTLTPITLSSDTFTNTPKCQNIQKTLLIPYSTPTGTYRLEVSGVYSVIPLRKPITVTATSDTFTIHAATTTQDIQALIDANTQLEEELQAQMQSHPSNSSTNNSVTNNTTTNNNTTNNNPPAQTGSGSNNNGGVINGIIKALGGGLKLSL